MVKKDNEEIFRLAHSQKRIWYVENIYSNSKIFNIGGALRINGKIDLEVLEKVVNILIEKNEAFRLRFKLKSNELYQYISEYKFNKLEKLNFRCDEEFDNWANNDFEKGFDLFSEVLYHWALCSVEDNKTYFYLKMHHIISDGWGFSIVVKQICDLYNRMMNNEDINSLFYYSYLDYIKNEQDYLKSERYAKDRKYYLDKFRKLPEDLHAEKDSGIQGRRKIYKLNSEMSQNIRTFVKEYKISLNTFFTSIYLIYINKLYQREDITVGIPVLNRSGKKERNIIGMFTSTMPFKYEINSELSIREMMNEINNELIKGFTHQKYPYDLLAQDLELSKNGYDCLFNACINTYNTNFSYNMNGVTTEGCEYYCGGQTYSLQLIIKDWEEDGRLTIAFDYKISEYTLADVETMYMYLSNIIESIINNPIEIIKKLDILNEKDKIKIGQDFNATRVEYPMDKTIYQLFEDQVERTPDNIAISFENQNLTYKELNNKSNQLARKLVYKGIDKNFKVGLMIKHSLETVIGILAVIKSGAAYVPIDVSYPIERINYMIDNSNIEVILTNCNVISQLEFKGEYINLKDEELYKGEKSNLEKISGATDLVYILYTSGSTGAPKGVMIEHRGLTNYIWWAKKMYVQSVDEIFALYSSLSFDLTITSIFTPLISGNRINIYNDDGDEFVLYKILRENTINILKLTPAHVSLLCDKDNKNSSIIKFIVGGENLSCELAAKVYESFGGKIEIFNEYGPTETVVGCMIHKYDPIHDREGSVPIGIPADNVQIYILDKHLNILPYGAIGEMYISGDGVARGYLGNDELTKKAFINNPFIKGNIMYKTGDRGKHRKDGKIEYIGRVDKQVKIRGHRIELGEIENKLSEIKGIKEVAVLVREESDGNKKLYAYIVSPESWTSHYVKSELLKFLPNYMIPSYIVFLDKMPLTSNGKINTKMLPVPQNNEPNIHEKVNPTNEFEQILIDITEKVLNVKYIGIYHNFYELGGDSIKAIQISGKLNDLGLSLKVKDILAHNSFAEIAACIESGNNTIKDQNMCEGKLGNTPIMQWFFERNFYDYNHFNQSVLLKIKSGISIKMLNTALEKLIEHHDSLRINYDGEIGALYYNNLNNTSKIQVVDLSNLDYEEQKNRIREDGEKLKGSFNISNTILFKACIFKMCEDYNQILLTAHHLVIDGVSWRIILEDLYNLLQQQINHLEFKLPLKTHSVKDWVEGLKQYSNNISEDEKRYWNDVLRSNTPLGINFNLGNDTFDYSATLKEILDEKETKTLITVCNEIYGININESLIISLLLALTTVYGESRFNLELEGHGREEIQNNIDISRTVGWFTSMYPVNLSSEGYDLDFQIKSIKEQLRSVHNKGFNYGILKYISKSIKYDDSKLIRFNYLGDFSTVSNNEIFTEAYEDTGSDCGNKNIMTCLIEVIAMIVDGRLNICINYSKNKFSEESMNSLCSEMLGKIRKIIIHCSNKNSKEFTPSDFDAVNICQEDLDTLFD